MNRPREPPKRKGNEMIGYIIVFVIGATCGAAGVVMWALNDSKKPRKRKSDKK